ncbi:hypothetical protein [Laspinema palackyanum]|uniref:hypothetical protein n=1 Tax=Laspinema palackyanum TaxID=3231601 RepID=UPI00345D892B|nr:hypothetical protein [Laspinema sp. D2c]
MSNAVEFLTKLAINPKTQVAFAKHSRGILEAAGLSDLETAALSSGDQAQIEALFAGGRSPIAVIVTDPGPDPLPDPDAPPYPDAPDSQPSDAPPYTDAPESQPSEE